MRHRLTVLNRFLLPLLLLSACSQSLQELKTISPVPDSFSNSLAAEYLAYAESEAEQGRTSSSEHFASKGVRAARGEAVDMDMVDEKSTSFRVLSGARKALKDAMNDKVKNAAPQKAARAQILFDCWNEQENKGLIITAATPAVASCGYEFSIVSHELSQLADSFRYGDDSKNTIRFVENSVQLDDEEKNKIKKIVSRLERHNNYKIELKTYQSSNYGREIPHKRMLMVRNELIGLGVPKSRIVFSRIEKESSDSEVRLSNDEERQYRDIVYVSVTYKNNLLVESSDE